MDNSNHNMVNMLIQQIGTIFNPLMQNSNHIYQQLEHKMGQIDDFFGVPQASIHPVPHIQAVGVVQNPGVANNEGVPNNQV